MTAPAPLPTPSLADITTAAAHLKATLGRVNAIASAMDNAIALVKKTELPKLKKAVELASQQEAALRDMVAAAPALFVKPKTLVLHDIKVGYMKGRGGIEWDNGDSVVAAIQKHLPEQAEALIRWSAKPLKEAINQLDVASLKKIGCRVVDTGETVIVKPVDGAGAKLAQALLAGAQRDTLVACAAADAAEVA